MQQTCFDEVSVSRIQRLCDVYHPDMLSEEARYYSQKGYLRHATEAALASIRARGNWMLVNGHWHRKG